MNHTILGLLALAGVLLLVGLSIRWSRLPGEGVGSFSKFFLVALRLVIGWHFLVEGLDKLNSPSWTSEGYLREASGPLAPHFRDLAGDRLIDKLTVGEDQSFPPALAEEWQAYFDTFSDYYELTAEQRAAAQQVFDKAKADTLKWLTVNTEPVTKIAAYPPPLVVEMTIQERLAEYRRLQQRVAEIEADLPRFGEEKFEEYKQAKTQVNRWRSALQASLERQTAQMKQALRDQVLFDIVYETMPAEHQKAIARPKVDPLKDDPERKQRDWINAIRSAYGQVSGAEAKLPSQTEKILANAYDRRLNDAQQDDPLPPSARPERPRSAWTMLDWADTFVKYGLVVVGGLLLVGLFTRLACVAGALFLLSFYLAMPPLPWWPESPRVEGHYLYINKNIIEMMALLALATLPTGRWAGLDALWQFLLPARWRSTPASGNVG